MTKLKSSQNFEEAYKKLNAKQKEAVDTIYGPLMVVAGPGTGKTTVLTLRIANILLKTDAKPDEILALTFTESGVRSIREKLRELIGDTSFRVNIFTFHGFANYLNSIYPEYFEKIGGKSPSTEIDAILIIEEILSKESFKELRPSIYGVKVRDIVKRISDLKREAINPSDLQKIIDNEISEHEAEKENGAQEKMTKSLESELERKYRYIRRLQEFQKTYFRYEEELVSRELYDFDDTILGLIDALSKHEDLVSEMRESFQFVLADEHQDANGSQNEILKFFKGGGEEEIDPPNIFVVGDDKQSIFRFQGASLENFYNFKEEFNGAKRIDLKNNYRSQSHILDNAHHLISHDGREHTELISKADHKVALINIREFNHFEDELSLCATEIKKLIEENKENTIAVISRNNNTLYHLSEYLQKEGIDYLLQGEKPLFESFEYKKIRFLFEALIDPLSDSKLLRSLYFGYFDLELHDVLALAGYSRKRRVNLGEIILKGELNENIELKNKEKFLAFKDELESLSLDSLKMPLLPFFKKLQNKIVCINDLESIEVLRELFLEARKLVQKNRNATLIEFVSHLSLLEKHNISPLIGIKNKKTRVELLSIHKSKGLEYDHVFIVDVTSKKFEKNAKKNDLLRIPGIGIEKEYEEDRRLLYVAITRAKKEVAISYSLSGQNDESTVPSVIISELDPNLINKEEFIEHKRTDLFSKGSELTPNIKDELREIFLQRNFSVTALNNFLECPWKYFFLNLMLVPDVGEFSAMLGTACHEALKEIHMEVKRGHLIDDIRVKNIAKKYIYKEAFSLSELPVALQKAEENITCYFNTFERFDPDENVFIEEEIHFPLKVQSKEFNIEVNVCGKIDLAIEKGGLVHVLDFKSRKRITRNDILGKTKNSDGSLIRQLQFYKFLWEKAKMGGEVEKGCLVFLTPERGEIQKETFELTESDKEEIENITKETIISIYTFSFWDNKCTDKKCISCGLGYIFKKEIKEGNR